jgi:lysophospholipase L1-like esterase
MRACKFNASILLRIGPSRRPWSFTHLLILVLAVATLAPRPTLADEDGRDGDHHWVATWATAPGAAFTYVPPVAPAPPGPPVTFAPATIQPDLAFPFPNANTAGAVDQTIRSIVKPDLWGNTMRFRFSNVFGTQPVTFNSVTVGLQEYSGNVVKGTLTRVTFGGSRSVTIPNGKEIFSDEVKLSWVKGADDPAVQGRNLAVSYSVQGESGRMTYHSGANVTSFVTPSDKVDHTTDLDVFAFEFTTTSWFFLDAVDVRASADTVVICAFGDSITDGTHTTLNTNDRWMNTLSRRLHNAYGSKVSIVNEAIGGNRVVNPVVAGAASGPAAVDRLDRDVLGLSGLTDVIWLEGINDIGAGHSTTSIIAGYQDVVGRLHANRIKVYAGTVTSALGISGVDAGDNGPGHNASRLVLNSFIRNSGLFDGVEDFDGATLDATTGNMRAEFLPNSQFTQLPWDYLHPNHAGYLAMGEAVDIKPFAPHKERKP